MRKKIIKIIIGTIVVLAVTFHVAISLENNSLKLTTQNIEAIADETDDIDKILEEAYKICPASGGTCAYDGKFFIGITLADE